MCLARELLGKDCYKAAVLELNASDERGIDVIRNRIKMFAQKKVRRKELLHVFPRALSLFCHDLLVVLPGLMIAGEPPCGSAQDRDPG